MELREGMYVRYRYNLEQRIGLINFIKHSRLIDEDFIGLINYDLVLEGNILKASDNPIDLIEVGDYVNGKEVTEIMKDEEGNVTDVLFTEEVESQSYSLLPIKNIVTKEYFNSGKYEVEQWIR